jgi:hypothetical protein
MSLGVGALLLGEPPRLRQAGRSLTEQDGSARQAEDNIDPASRGQPLAHLGGGTRAVPTDEERGPWPVPPQHGEETPHDHGMFSPRRARARAQAGGHPGVCGPRANAQRHRAITPLVVVRERAGLLARGRVIGVSEVEHHGGGRLGGARDAVGDQGVGESGEVLAVDAVCKARQGGGTRAVLCGLEGWPLHAARQQGVVPEALGSLAVRIPGGEVRDTLGEEVTEGRGDRGWRPLVLSSSGKAFGEADLAVDAPQHEGTKVGRQGPACDIGPPGIASDRRKTPWFWATIGQKHTSCRLYGMDWTRILFYQRLTRGLSIFMKNSG